jgi:hypothetical protein
MSVSDRANPDLLNRGVIQHHPAKPAAASGGQTFIVTGLHRSGTSLVASVLRQIGIFMGTEINEIVHEDEAIAKILIAGDQDGLRRLIRQRDTNYGTWGFKFPMLSPSLRAEDIASFSDPHFIVMFRDPVAIAVRTSLSEYQDPVRALRTAVTEQADLLTFIDRLRVPTLLLSYEKSLIFPADFIDAILGFCGLPRNDALREQLVRVIEPNRPSYIAQARRRYEGIVEGVIGGRLHGWCRLTGVADPVTLDLLVDGLPVRTFVADRFRQDLSDAGFGAGHHAFSVDLGDIRIRPDQVIRVRVAARGIELENSGHRLDRYAAEAAPRPLP